MHLKNYWQRSWTSDENRYSDIHFLLLPGLGPARLWVQAAGLDRKIKRIILTGSNINKWMNEWHNAWLQCKSVWLDQIKIQFEIDFEMYWGWATTLWGKYINKVAGKVGHRKKEAVVEEEDYLCPEATAIVMKKKKKSKNNMDGVYTTAPPHSQQTWFPLSLLLQHVGYSRVDYCQTDSLAKRVIRLQSAHRKHFNAGCKGVQ